PFFSAANERRSQQIMDRRHILHARDRLTHPVSNFDSFDEGRELSAIRYGISPSAFLSVSLSLFGEKPIVIQNEQIGPLQFGQGAFGDSCGIFCRPDRSPIVTNLEETKTKEASSDKG